jgi:VanZ family protein
MPFSFSKVGVDRRWLAAAVVYAAVIFMVSSRPYLRPPGPEFQMKDNLAHAFEYAVLAALLFRALGALAWPDLAITFLMVVAVTASVGAADEMFQGTVPGRQRDVMDWVCDATGAALATAACMAWARRRVVIMNAENTR